MPDSYLDRLMATATVRALGDEYEAMLDLCDELCVCAPTSDEALAELRDAAHEWILARIEDGDPLPTVGGLLDDGDNE